MTYSLQEAADAAGVNKSTILRAIQAGKVSATRNEHDQWLIEPAELHRVYPPAIELRATENLKAMATTRTSPNPLKPPGAPTSRS